jgi:hypothetical protein
MPTRDEVEAIIVKLERAIKKQEATLGQLRGALDGARNMLSVTEILDQEEAQLPLLPSIPTPGEPKASRIDNLKKSGLSLKSAIRETIDAQDGAFTVANITEALGKRYPKQFNNAQKGSVSSIISKIAKEKYIRQIEAGSGSKAPRYLRVK